MGLKKKSQEGTATGRKAIADGISFIGQLIRDIGRLLLRIVKPILYILVGIVLLIFVGIWIGMLTGLIYGIPYLKFIFPGSVFFSTLASLSLFVALALPVLFVVLFFIKILTGYRAPVNVRRTLGGLWLASMGAAVVFGISTAREFSESDTLTESSQLAIDSDTLVLDIRDQPKAGGIFNIENNLVGKDALYLDNARFSFLRSADSKFKLEKEMKARGRSAKQAREALGQLRNPAELLGNVLQLKNYVEVPKSAKFRGQAVHYKIFIPQGKYIKIDGSIYYLGQVERDPNADHPTLSNNLWKMTETGMISPGWSEKRSLGGGEYRDFNRLQLTGPMEIFLFRSDSFKVEAMGKKEYVDRISIDQLKGRLMVENSGDPNRVPVKLHIGLPELNKLDVRNTLDIHLEGFVQDHMELLLKDGEDLDARMVIGELIIETSGRSDIELSGSGKSIDAWLDSGSDLDAEDYECLKVSIQGSPGRVELSSIDSLFAAESLLGRIDIRGKQPVIISSKD